MIVEPEEGIAGPVFAEREKERATPTQRKKPLWPSFL
jgi:hypothetical protein